MSVRVILIAGNTVDSEAPLGSKRSVLVCPTLIAGMAVDSAGVFDTHCRVDSPSCLSSNAAFRKVVNSDKANHGVFFQCI